jgi:AAA+ ATPase superfamily predicted ATPase
MFVGRKKELEALDDAYRSDKGEMVVIYGRRRIGKSCLVEQFAKNKPHYYAFEAIEGEKTAAQIKHFTDFLKTQLKDPILDSVEFKSWEKAFAYITDKIITRKNSKKKKILFFDELQWMAAGRSKLVSYIKFYWDKYWKNNHVMLILCGSVASFMVKKVLSSNALYGRVTLEILLKGLPANEAARMFKNKRSKEEILKYLMVFGGVPKYLEMIDLDRSFNQNMNKLCFSPRGPMVQEVERLFYSQFREVQTYKKIVSLLKTGIYSLEEISKLLKISSGGGLKLYLENLVRAEIIRSYIPFGKGIKSKLKKYSLADEYLHFYFKYIEPNLLMLREGLSGRFFETLSGDSFHQWLGFAFERFCFKHAGILAGCMGFKDEVMLVSPYFAKGDRTFQIDLLFLRADKAVTVCEIKHLNEPAGKGIIPDMERRCALFEIPRGHTMERALVSLYGPDDALRETGYFNHYITLEDILN